MRACNIIIQDLTPQILLNRLHIKDYPPNQDPTGQNPVTYHYDNDTGYCEGQLLTNGVGRLTAVTDTSGKTCFSYDSSGRVTRSSTRIDVNGTINTYTVQKTYNDLGQTTSITYPDGEAVNSTYDLDGNLHGVGGYAAISNYNALRQPGRIGFQNGASTTFSYYPLNNRLQELSTTTPGAGTVQDFGYGYDNNGNIRSITDNADPTHNRNQTFTYDGLNRLTSAQSGAYGAIVYGLDEIGNINSSFDSGNSADRTGQTLVYDYDSRVTSITNGGATTSFVYNYQGTRVKKTSDTGGAETIYLGGLYEIKDGIATKHIFAGGRRIASKTGTGPGSYVYYYHLDHLGSLSVATNGSGVPVQNLTYYPYGEVRTNTRAPGSTDPPTIDLPYKFTGKELDSETGLYNFGARYYDAAVGRFISADTMVQSPGNPQSLNRYSYCVNNPLAYVDPDGHFWFAVLIGMAIGALFGGVMAAITHQNILLGILTGAVIGGISGGIAFEINGAMAASLNSVIANTTLRGAVSGAVAGMASGGVAGGLNAAFHGGNIGKGILMGAAIGAVTGAALGAYKGYSQSSASAGEGMRDMDQKDIVVHPKDPSGDELRGFLGTYRGSGIGLYADNDLIYYDSDTNYHGFLIGGPTKNFGIAGSFATGQGFQDSSEIYVWGEGNEPTGWQLRQYAPTGKYDGATGWAVYGWKVVPEAVAIKSPLAAKAYNALIFGSP